VPALLDDTELLRRLVGFDSVSRTGNLTIAEFHRAGELLDRMVSQSCVAEAL